MHLCRQAIDWLIRCYTDHNMPHYFIPKQNLIRHLPENKCREMESWLMDIRDRFNVVTLSSTMETRDQYINKCLRQMFAKLGLPMNCTAESLVSSIDNHTEGREAVQEFIRTVATHPRYRLLSYNTNINVLGVV